MPVDLVPILPIVGIIVGVLLILSVVLRWYKKVPQDKVGVGSDIENVNTDTEVTSILIEDEAINKQD